MSKSSKEVMEELAHRSYKLVEACRAAFKGKYDELSHKQIYKAGYRAALTRDPSIVAMREALEYASAQLIIYSKDKSWAHLDYALQKMQEALKAYEAAVKEIK